MVMGIAEPTTPPWADETEGTLSSGMLTAQGRRTPHSTQGPTGSAHTTKEDWVVGATLCGVKGEGCPWFPRKDVMGLFQ